MKYSKFSGQDFYLLSPEQQLPHFLDFLRNGRGKAKSPFPCKVKLKGRGTTALGFSKNTIQGAEVKGEFIVIKLKLQAWGNDKYEVFFHNSEAYCRIENGCGRGIDPEFTIEL